MRILRWSIVVLALVLVVLRYLPDLGGADGGAPAGEKGGTVRVVRIVDGDTIVVRRDGRDERVRYIGVDTPESVKPGTAVQCFGHEASAENRRLVAGRDVRLTVGEEARDRYGRLLAYVSLPSGASVNETLLRGGYARTLTIPPNDRYAGRFARLQDEARRARRGLWRACTAS